MLEQEWPKDRKTSERARKLESQELGRYDAVLAFSHEDEEWMRRRLELPRLYYSPMVVDFLQQPAEARNESGGEPRFCFLGGYRHPPNIMAVRWLCEEIVPQLRRAIPGMKVEIIGADYPSRFVRKYAAADVSFLGYVERLADKLCGSIFLCPVQFGSGMRIKIIEAVFHDAPVISTTVGAGGLGLEAERHFLAADTPEEFARQAKRLVEDKALCGKLAAEAKTSILATFSPETAGRHRIAALEQIIQKYHAQGGRRNAESSS